MAKFNDLNQIQKYLERNANTVFTDKKIQQVLAKEMQKAVQDVVYKRYTPKVYVRRENDGGLSDTRNMHITKVEVIGTKVRVLFENLTTGQTRQLPIYEYNIDSLHGKFITDTINDGIRNNWYSPDERDGQGRTVSAPRPYIEETIKRIKANPRPLVEAIKSAYIKIGFQVK